MLSYTCTYTYGVGNKAVEPSLALYLATHSLCRGQPAIVLALLGYRCGVTLVKTDTTAGIEHVMSVEGDRSRSSHLCAARSLPDCTAGEIHLSEQLYTDQEIYSRSSCTVAPGSLIL